MQRIELKTLEQEGIRPGVRKGREAASQARGECNPTTFYPRLYNQAPGVPQRTPRTASGYFKISRETHQCLTSVRPSANL